MVPQLDKQRIAELTVSDPYDPKNVRELMDELDLLRDVFRTALRAVAAEAMPEMLRQDTSDVDFGQGTVGRVFQQVAQYDLRHIPQALTALGESGP